MDYKKAFTWTVVAGVIVLLILGIALGVSVSGSAGVKAILKIEQAHGAGLDKKMGVLLGSIETLEAAVKVLGEDVKGHEARDRALEAELKKSNAKLAETLEKLKDAPPETIVGETRRILKTDEVWFRSMDKILEMSNQASLKNIFTLADWEHATIVREPALKGQIFELRAAGEGKDVIIQKKDLEINKFAEIKVIDDEKYSSLKRAVDEIAKLKTIPWLERLADRFIWTGIGFGVGALYESGKKR